MFSRIVSIFIASAISVVATFFLMTSSLPFQEQKSTLPINKKSDGEVFEHDISNIVKSYENSVAYIESKSDGDLIEVGGVSNGTGFFIKYDDEFYIITNEHVIHNANSVSVSIDELEMFESEIVGKDYDLDLAVLKVVDNQFDFDKVEPMALGDSDQIELGEPVFTIGYPLNIGYSVTSGILSGYNKSFYIDDVYYESLLQTDAPINPGNSGGPLLNMNGEVIGVNTAITEEGQGLGFSIPINNVKEVIEPLITEGQIKRPFIGIEYMLLDEKIVVLNVLENSPAEKSGILKNDVILKINDNVISNQEDLTKIITEQNIGDIIEITVSRDDKEKKMDVTVGNKNEILKTNP